MTILLILIALTFIGLGVGDPLLGSAWPSMYGYFGVDAAAAGILGMLISGSTIVGTYISARILRRFGTGVVLAAGLTVIGITVLGFSMANHFIILCFLAIPLGFSIGNIGASANGFLTIHYSAKYLNWMNCLWGVGATVTPVVMAFSLVRLGGWMAGYRIVGTAQLALAVILLATLSQWKKVRLDKGKRAGEDTNEALGAAKLLRLPGARFAILLFFFQGGLEATLVLWSTTYLVTAREIARETATSWLTLYYLGLTGGRLLGGFISMRLRSRKVARLGICLIIAGIITIALPFGWNLMPGLILIGLGVAPLFPSFTHCTPGIFGKQHTQSMVGFQMASLFLGASTLPPLFGLIGSNFGYHLFPVYAGVLLAIMATAAAILYTRHPDKGEV